MRQFLEKIPHACAICLATLICAIVVALQNAESYAERLEVAASTLGTEGSELLRQIGSLLGATGLNDAERYVLSSLRQAADGEEAEEAFQPLSDEAEQPSPLPTPQVAEPAAPPCETRPQPEPADAPRKTIPAVESPCWPALSTYLGRSDSLAARYHDNVPTGALLLRRPSATAPRPPKPAPATPWVQVTPGQQPKPVQTEQEPPRPTEPTAPETTEDTPTTAPTTPAKPPVGEDGKVLTQSPPIHYRLMMVGDSLMEDLGPRLHRVLSNRKGLEMVVSAKFSTGLCRPQYFDWPAHLSEQLAKHKPDMVVFFIGANDAMPVRDGKRMVPLGSEAWREAYIRKIDEVVSMARGVGAEVVWIELPAVGNRYGKALRDNQIAQREFCERTGTRSVRTDEMFSGEWGRYEAYATYKDKKVRVRRQDKVHLTPEGNMILVDCLLPLVEENMLSCYAAHPERKLTEAELARTKNVPIIYTCKGSVAPAKPARRAAAPSRPAPSKPAAP